MTAVAALSFCVLKAVEKDDPLVWLQAVWRAKGRMRDEYKLRESA
jgi:hypothetical protein